MRIVLLLLPVLLAAADPRFPADRYLVAEGMASQPPGKTPITQAELREQARESARSELARCIRVRVVSELVRTQTDDGKSYSDRTASVSASTTDVELPGLLIEDAQRGADWHAVAAVERAALARHYLERSAGHAAAARRAADRAAGADDPQTQRQAWSQASTAAAAADADLALAGFAGADISAVRGAVQAVAQQAAQALAQLESGVPATLTALADRLALRLAGASGKAGALRLAMPTARDTAFPSQLGGALRSALAAALAQAGATVAGDQGPAGVAVTVQLWPAGHGAPDNRFRVTAQARAMPAGTVLAAVDLLADAAACEGIALEPANFAQLLADRRAIESDAVIGSALRAELSTAHGADGLVFTAGQRTRLFARVNRTCFVRVLYHLADGRRAVLLDNHRIEGGDAGRLVELPTGELECSAPFGAETIQLIASTAAMPPIRTTLVDGYPILAEDLGGALARTRGLKAVAAQQAETTEARLSVTTLSRP